MSKRITPKYIDQLGDNQIFVFGSNLSGIHGAGAAKLALKWGAKWGDCEGLRGKTYAIPTKDKNVVRTLSVNEIRPYVDRFTQYAEQNPKLTFLVTEIGCGLAGLTPNQIAPLFKEAESIDNIHLPATFWYLDKIQ